LFLQHSSHFQSQYHLQPVSFSYWWSWCKSHQC
jgi:hypothetical protein